MPPILKLDWFALLGFETCQQLIREAHESGRESWYCQNCGVRGPLTPQGRCSTCHSNAVAFPRIVVAS